MHQPPENPTWLSDDERSRLGAFYTPQIAADFIAAWAIRRSASTVLDPSVGGGALLDAFERAASEQGNRSTIYACDVDQEAVERLGSDGWNVRCADFLALRPGTDHPLVDLVLMNPPYVRHHLLGARHKQARIAFARAGLSMPGTASLWLSHLVHAVSFVADGGGLAAIVPRDLIDSESGQRALGYIERTFREIAVHTFEQRLFPGLGVDAIIVLASGKGAGAAGSVRVIANLSVSDNPNEQRAEPVHGADHAVRQATALLDRMERGGGYVRLGDLAEISLGLVTGDKRFFVLTDDQARTLPAEALRPVLSSTADAPGLVFAIEDHLRLLASGKPALLFAPRKDPKHQSTAERRKISEGERANVDGGYKCSRRTPWYVIPGAERDASPLLLTYVNDVAPRLIENKAKALATNAFHNVKPKAGVDEKTLASVFANPITMLSAEVYGRRIGGGALRLDISAARRLLIPWPPGVSPPSKRPSNKEDSQATASRLLADLRGYRRR